MGFTGVRPRVWFVNGCRTRGDPLRKQNVDGGFEVKGTPNRTRTGVGGPSEGTNMVVYSTSRRKGRVTLLNVDGGVTGRRR